MKSRAYIPIITLLSLLALISTGVGCDRIFGSESIDMAKDIPEYSDEFSFLDVGELRDDDDLGDMYESLEDDYDSQLDKYGIDFDDVDRLVSCEDSLLLYGEFDLDEIREELDDLDYEDDEYRNVEVWESDGLLKKYVAVIGEDLVILGSEESVKDCIKVIEEGEDSLSDNRDYKDVIGRLPDGIMVMYSTDAEYPGQESQGISIQVEDEDTLKITRLFKFEDEDAAEDSVNAIEDDIEEYNDNLRHIDVDQDDEFVKVTAEMYIDDFGDF